MRNASKQQTRGIAAVDHAVKVRRVSTFLTMVSLKLGQVGHDVDCTVFGM